MSTDFRSSLKRCPDTRPESFSTREAVPCCSMSHSTITRECSTNRSRRADLLGVLLSSGLSSHRQDFAVDSQQLYSLDLGFEGAFRGCG
jgi:hypothetical protein